MSRLTQGRYYTRDEIHEVLGGNKQHYLPTQGGKIVCACLRPDLNPVTPSTIFVGKGGTIEKSGRMLAATRLPIPIFLKRHVNKWEYVGKWRVTGSTERKSEIRKYEGRSDAALMIFMKRAEGANNTSLASESPNQEIEQEYEYLTGGGFGDAATNAEVEKAAVASAAGYYKRRNWDVKSVERLKVGYDLRCRRSRKELHVEVKGVRGQKVEFILTRGELKRAENDDAWLIHVVISALKWPRH